MRRVLSAASSVVLALGAVFLALGVVAAWRGDPRAEVRVDAPSKSFGRVPAGRTVPVVFRIANPGGRTAHILGARGVG